MAIDSIGATTLAASAEPQATINQDDLFKILLTQLNYQDPLKPLDNAEFISQLAQFTGLELSRQTSESVTSLLQQQATEQSIGLIGRTVEVSTATGAVVGMVTTIDFNSGSPLMSIQTSNSQFLNDISLSQVQVVR